VVKYMVRCRAGCNIQLRQFYKLTMIISFTTDPRCNTPPTKQPLASRIKPLTISTSVIITSKKKHTTQIKTKTKPTPKEVVTTPPTRQISTEEKQGLQSDDPRVTLQPTLSTHSTLSVQAVTSDPRPKVRMITQEDCSHNHGKLFGYLY
jgi:hypothetical protein